MSFADKNLTCSQCGLEFVISAGEQGFFDEKGFTHLPKRCKRCAAKHMGTRFRTQSRITCAECGTETTVPFQPNQNRPVLCRKCFTAQRNLVAV
jgi:CxxC-x17-CxxC domain-containing protein